MLIPLEQEAERLGGRLPAEPIAAIRAEAVARRLNGGRHAVEHGGQGWTMLEWFLVNEQFGRVTNGLHWHVPNAYNVLGAGTPEQIDRYLRPALRGEAGGDAYAVTEALAGLRRRRRSRRRRARSEGGWVIDGEKWFVTSGDVAAVLIVMAIASTAATGCRRCSSSSRARRASSSSTTRSSRTTTRTGTRRSASRDVEVAPDAVIGGVGDGDALQRAWFTEERLGIATHGLGAMWRLLDETIAWALRRASRAGSRIIDHQGISFPLADSATDATVGRLLALHVARADRRRAPTRS